jgi:hypothetical protein
VRILTSGLRALALALVVGVACGRQASDPQPTRVSASPSIETADPSVSGTESWLAVVAVADLADDLDAQTRSLKEILGTSMVVSPATCFAGLPQHLSSGYVLGATGSTKEAVETAVRRAGIDPIAVRSVTILCTD